MVYSCELCNYFSIRSDNYNKHLKTKKHKKNCNEPEIEYVCSICSQNFNSRTTLYRHTKQCDIEKKIEQKLEKKYELAFNEINRKLDNIQPQTIYNTTNHNTINNTIILSYVDTDTDHLKDSDYKKIVNAVNFCVKMLVWKKHFNKEKPENMNLCISNKKDSYMKVFMKDKWTSRKIDEMIHTLFEENEMQIEDWLNEFNDPNLNDKYSRYTKNKENEELLEELQTDLKQFMYDMTKELGIGKTKGMLTFDETT